MRSTPLGNPEYVCGGEGATKTRNLNRQKSVGVEKQLDYSVHSFWQAPKLRLLQGWGLNRPGSSALEMVRLPSRFRAVAFSFGSATRWFQFQAGFDQVNEFEGKRKIFGQASAECGHTRMIRERPKKAVT